MLDIQAYGPGSVELNRKAKGDLAELKVATDLRERGYKIAFPTERTGTST